MSLLKWTISKKPFKCVIEKGNLTKAVHLCNALQKLNFLSLTSRVWSWLCISFLPNVCQITNSCSIWWSYNLSCDCNEMIPPLGKTQNFHSSIDINLHCIMHDCTFLKVQSVNVLQSKHCKGIMVLLIKVHKFMYFILQLE